MGFPWRGERKADRGGGNEVGPVSRLAGHDTVDQHGFGTLGNQVGPDVRPVLAGTTSSSRALVRLHPPPLPGGGLRGGHVSLAEADRLFC